MLADHVVGVLVEFRGAKPRSTSAAALALSRVLLLRTALVRGLVAFADVTRPWSWFSRFLLVAFCHLKPANSQAYRYT